jgi:poly(3-hydroxyalkanoate) synthetase
MEFFLGIIIACFIILVAYLLIKISSYKDLLTYFKSQLDFQENRNVNLTHDKERLRRIIDDLNNELKKIQSKNLKVGSTFFYPRGFNFKEELVGKRAKIVSIQSSSIKSMLIDEKGFFVDDVVWEGTADSSLNYIYENNNTLYFEFK